MSRLDLVIFGATGFTGLRVVEQLAKVAKKYPAMTWGVAGRSQAKLEALMANIGKKIGEDMTSIRIIIAEVTNERSLQDMCEQAKVLINCCGPYLMYGEPVVKAAVEAKTHCVDVSGEPQYIENVQLKYNDAAKEAGVYIVSACGFDSIPNDMGLVYLQQNFEGTLNSVESYVSVEVTPEFQNEAAKSGIIHFGTWESAIISAGRSKELVPLRKMLYSDDLPVFEPKLRAKSTFHKLDEDQWCVPFPGVDESVVYRTQRFFHDHENQRAIQFKTYIKIGSLCTAIQTGFGGVLITLLSKTAPTMKLLLKYPKLFSGGMVTSEGPTENVMNNTKFTFELYGEGWDKNTDVSEKPNKKAVVKVKGVNPAYGATVTAVIYCAIACLTEQDKIPGIGGVLTTGAAFHNTSLIKNLHENNLTFEYIPC
ncbi:saccharopine dehydrogenase-like oxidoreductase [Cydia pomonella]|uniref:saccharopine dehydrogenase-like oxidoreductase n=1 Tax=Cydia pomonella TaxID=82600 RepID=UPI002ADDCB63|nr:saccharopine dehydrogenase-like oxidoreductase [Cydia pomonella]XP_061704841.1 saccharopine dehydrogenase-like oxidoreductase [Cydia pomonella]XP_061704842.1 saccharopine dehydrogenase-like oxidoreductase [Cydia pomonella]